MRYEVKGGSFPVVVCNLDSGEQMITEKGSMVWMSPNMKMDTRGGGLGKMFSKAFSGESMFQNTYTAQGDGMIAFGSSFPGQINDCTRAGNDRTEERVPGGRIRCRTIYPLQQKTRGWLFRGRGLYYAAPVRPRNRLCRDRWRIGGI